MADMSQVRVCVFLERMSRKPHHPQHLHLSDAAKYFKSLSSSNGFCNKNSYFKPVCSKVKLLHLSAVAVLMHYCLQPHAIVHQVVNSTEG